MRWRRGMGLLLTLLVASGCKRASQYGPVHTRPGTERPDEPKETLHAHYAWIAPQPRPDVPIVFVPPSAAEWKKLPVYWNHFPSPPAGPATIHLGLPPVNAAAAMLLAEQMQTIKIKVPRGLPDPTPHIPPSNPLTLGKWKLGKKIFFDAKLASGKNRLACASCHQPQLGFAESAARAARGRRNTLGLANVVYNKQQFWDGRVDALEQVLVRRLEDEGEEGGDDPQTSHVWGKGLVKRLAADLDYDLQFKLVFGTRQATQDAIAKSLATYLRTLLSGDSLYDNADVARKEKGDAELTAEHFRPLLKLNTLVELGALAGTEKPDDLALEVRRTAARLERGYRLFHGRGQCASCHSAPLFTDQGFHNIGLASAEKTDDPWEAGRFAHVPIGLKESRWIGAFRTPSLRNLAVTAPYFHDGSRRNLREVVRYYDLFHESVHPELTGSERPLDLSSEQTDDLVLFLNALNGQAVDAAVRDDPKK